MGVGGESDWFQKQMKWKMKQKIGKGKRERKKRINCKWKRNKEGVRWDEERRKYTKEKRKDDGGLKGGRKRCG